MCGIAGFMLAGSAPSGEAATAWIGGMTDALRRRGPDDGAVWLEDGGATALGHRRLSILDLSPAGRQPMASADGGCVIVFNGEIYNFQEIRDELTPSVGRWRGGSDTEVLVEAAAAWGLERTLSRISGMFAFALWDRRRRRLCLARDRLGKKPLYYGWIGRSLAFGSELKALRAFPGFEARISPQALTEYLRYSYAPSPLSIFEGVYKLPPGAWLVLDEAQAARPFSAEEAATRPRVYWSAGDMVRAARQDPFTGDEAEAARELEAALSAAVARRMIADVPLGALLSGGIDSSAVVALMQAQSPRPVRTFSIGHERAAYNEARHAAAVARHLGTDHHELYVTPRDALEVIPQLPEIYDEPFADPSQIPTFLVSRLTREHVTVALSGDGGDELFGGYNRHLWGPALWRRVGFLPPRLRAGAGALLARLSPAAIDAACARLGRLLPARLRHNMPGEKLRKIAEALPARDFDELYLRLCSQWKEPGRLSLRAANRADGEAGGSAFARARLAACPDGLSPAERMMFLDLVTYLPEDVLTKVDRASMAVGLEVRAPLLDDQVARLAWRLPLEMKTRGGQGKRILRRVLHRHVPPELVERPKMGFGAPIGAWLRGPLRDWAEDLLGEAGLRADGFLDPGPVRRAWREHLSGRRNNQYELWNICMFQAWRRGLSALPAAARETSVRLDGPRVGQPAAWPDQGGGPPVGQKLNRTKGAWA